MDLPLRFQNKSWFELGREFDIPVITDLGSGALIDLSQYDLPNEPTVQEKVAQGVKLSVILRR